MTSTSTLSMVPCEADGTSIPVELAFDAVILVGYTGRDPAAVLDHIRELETLGVTAPDLLAEVEAVAITAAHKLIFGGTLPTLGGFSFGQRFEVELRDPVLHRTLRCAYDIVLEGV